MNFKKQPVNTTLKKFCIPHHGVDTPWNELQENLKCCSSMKNFKKLYKEIFRNYVKDDAVLFFIFFFSV